MMDLREAARGEACRVWLPGCRRSPETVVLAHIRRANVAGMGQKPPDLCAVYACDKCHAIIDGREMLAGLTRLELDQQILFALCRTLAAVQRKLDAA